MSETLRQRLLAAVFDDEVIGDDLVRDVALSSEAHGELVRLATVLAGLPGRGARAAEARLDSLLDQVSLVAASMCALARGSDVMRRFADPPPGPPAEPRAPSDPPMFAGHSSVAMPGDPPRSARIRVRTPVLVGVAAAAAILVGFLAWPDPDVDETPLPPRAALPAVVALCASDDDETPSRPAARAPVAEMAASLPSPTPAALARAAAAEQAALVHVEIRVSPSTARIAIDDVPVDGNPFSGSRVRDGGTHRIRVTAPGYISRTVAVEFDANVMLDVSLERAPDVMAAVRSPARQTARPPPGPEAARPPPGPEAAADREPPARLAMELTVPKTDRFAAPDPPDGSAEPVALWITTNVPGSEIVIDDAMVGTTPLRQPLSVRPGRHTITVMHAGYLPRTRFIELDAANTRVIEIASPPPEAAIDASPVDPPVRRIDPVNPYVPDR